MPSGIRRLTLPTPRGLLQIGASLAVLSSLLWFLRSSAGESVVDSFGLGGSLAAVGPVGEARRANATFVILARNEDLLGILDSIRGMEARFNKNYNYPYTFLNEKPFTEEFKTETSALASGPCEYGLIPSEQWEDIPEWINKTRAEEARLEMGTKNKAIPYGDSLSYRQMCRYESGFFWRHPSMNRYKWYWRIEPNVQYFCNLSYDPFIMMEEKKKRYGWVISMHEFEATVPTLWAETKKFMEMYPQFLASPNLWEWLTPNKGSRWTRCHFWSNFEIADLDFFRGEAYTTFFEYLDRAGGFFYERWGDAPVHSLAVSLFLRRDELHYFRDIGYSHAPLQQCPKDSADNCDCDPSHPYNFEFHGASCTPHYQHLTGGQWE